MPKAKASDASKINKAAWIRAQPGDMPAADVVKKAQAAGIKLSVAQVYTTRSQAKQRGGKLQSPAKAKRGSKPRVAAGGPTPEESFFRKLVVHTIGRARAQELLNELASIGL